MLRAAPSATGANREMRAPPLGALRWRWAAPASAGGGGGAVWPSAGAACAACGRVRSPGPRGRECPSPPSGQCPPARVAAGSEDPRSLIGGSAARAGHCRERRCWWLRAARTWRPGGLAPACQGAGLLPPRAPSPPAPNRARARSAGRRLGRAPIHRGGTLARRRVRTCEVCVASQTPRPPPLRPALRWAPPGSHPLPPPRPLRWRRCSRWHRCSRRGSRCRRAPWGAAWARRGPVPRARR
mmetsp:Transcript_21110/g.66269  ORF Transcript_21110/g.66269 Transcript_21110/m.66269 type:complete len:241 (+) Transcript_21110:426-1148(+)